MRREQIARSNVQSQKAQNQPSSSTRVNLVQRCYRIKARGARRGVRAVALPCASLLKNWVTNCSAIVIWWQTGRLIEMTLTPAIKANFRARESFGPISTTILVQVQGIGN